jgi:hypothetical protein
VEGERMTLELDHVFIFTSAGAPAAERLVELGLLEGSRNVHPGQGTANRRFFFRNGMLELLWVQDESEARSEPIARTCLWERSRFRQTGASPFGISLRAAAGTALPFPTWGFRPPYLPAGLDIPVAETASWAEPLLFAIPFGGRPDSFPPERREPLAHPAGLAEITGLRVTLVGVESPSPALRAVEQLGLAQFVPGAEPLLELTFDQAQGGRAADLRPDLPLMLYW